VIVQIGPPATHFDQYTRTDLYTAAIARAEKAEAECRKLALREICDGSEVFELRKERDAMREALVTIDALDPESAIWRFSENALRGLALRMGETARQALKGTPNED
jgi:hypothetical protein